MKKLPILSIIIPCFNEEHGIAITIKIIQDVLDDLIDKSSISSESFIIFIDDGSTDSTFEQLKSNRFGNQKILKLTVNKGQQVALLAGIDFVLDRSDCAISIDSDLQDDLTVIEKMVEAYKAGYDIVCGVKGNRDTDSFVKRKTAKAFYCVMHKLGVPLIENHSEFRLLSRQAMEALSKYKERNIFLRGILRLVTLNITTISYTQSQRLTGKSKYSFGKLISLAIKGITSFSIVPIRFISVFGFILFCLTMFQSVYVLWVYFKGAVIPGWASITLPMYFLGGVQLLSLGVIGEYIAKIYTESKQRPFYHIEQIVE